MTRSEGVARLALAATFVTALVVAQVLAVKILALSLPVDLPVVGGEIIVPAGVLAYALTFLATDCYAELYGKRPAQALVNVGFAMILVMLGLVWLAILAPGSPVGVDPDLFARVLAPSTNIVLGGLLAYLVSQNWDVLVFHRIRERTGTELLWARNVGSTASSQALDTVVFVSVAFSLAPALFGIGVALPAGELLALIVGQYLIKLLIALADTPVVYAVVGLVRSRRDERGATPAD
ncbi:queuosine precursor transporter [Halalkalicoccus sp. NIPERK01]|uniref:queuosine precursor transporter n=1 Tax=Halalkalicoccus sp. NIPERK01 TaxID=3053469 RepID=UPI00256F0F7A|nr:queuosine precursor transporter [Halalkalicoccus sp. NIPERK01]MDL5363533.1 queuosine precursor transporter [Halalkalicoccus sp. NIPERK01]